MRPAYRHGRALWLIVPLLAASGCVYYNTFYNATKRYAMADAARLEAETRETGERSRTRLYMRYYMEAIRKASIVLDRHPDSKWVDDSLLLIGKAFYWRRDYSEALLKFRELQQNFPQSEFIIESSYWEGLSLWSSERVDEAREVLSGVVEAAGPELSRKSRLALARLETEQGNYAAAVAAYHDLLSKDKASKKDAETWQGLGNAHFELGNYDQALDAYHRVLSSKPDSKTNYQTRLRIGRSLENQEKFDDALQTYDRMLRIKRFRSLVPDVQLKRANVYRLMGNLTEADTIYVAVIEKNPRTEFSAAAYYQMGLIEQRERKDLARAQEHFEQARKERPNSDAGTLARERLRDLSDLEKFRKAAEKEGKKGFEARLSMAELYLFRLQEPDSALAMYNLVLETADTTEYAPKALFAIGLVYADSLADVERARESFERIIHDHPTTSYAFAARERIGDERTDDALAEARFVEAEALAQEGVDPGESLKILRQIAEEYPNSLYAPKSLYSLAWTHENRLGQLEPAREAYQLLVDRYPMTDFAAIAREKLEGNFLKAPAVEVPVPAEPARTDTSAQEPEEKPSLDPGGDPQPIASPVVDTSTVTRAAPADSSATRAQAPPDQKPLDSPEAAVSTDTTTVVATAGAAPDSSDQRAPEQRGPEPADSSQVPQDPPASAKDAE
ncbi:MAG: tetratricopeptide repeat protein [Candidatus Latescibacteria bacterium]|jgi:tetratricopeptide (TPR) repeat protein|nr:tetratricopeptide repeat protein [Candidatus Latescibacterota bacterium]